MSNTIVYHGIKLSENAKIYNLEVEELEQDPNPIRVGRIWFDLQTKHFKYTTLDDNNNITIQVFCALTDIPSSILDANSIKFAGNINNQYVNLSVNSNVESSLNVIIQHLNNLYSKLLTFNHIEYFVTNSTIQINNITLSKSIFNKDYLTVIINGLEQSSNSFLILSNNKTLQFIENLPLDSIIKVINTEIIL